MLVIPYTQIFQSGVPFLAYSFGLPVIATDVGSLTGRHRRGKTGLICRARDPSDLARGAYGVLFQQDVQGTVSDQGRDQTIRKRSILMAEGGADYGSRLRQAAL